MKMGSRSDAKTENKSLKTADSIIPQQGGSMLRSTALAVLMLAMLSACATPTEEQRVINDAAAALGGAQRLLAVKTLVIEGGGTHYNLGQDVAPGASGQTWAVTEYRRAIDIANERARTELTRVPKFTYWQGLAPQ